MRVRWLLAAVAVVLVCLAAPAASVAASGRASSVEGLGPEPTVCNVFALVPNCYYAAVSGTDTFHLSNHFARPGQVISGTYSWEIGGQGAGEFPSYGSVRALTGGPGLKLLGCTGKLFADNRKAAYKSPHAFDVTEGHATCRWKATAVTPWSVALGLKVYAGGQYYVAGDFYTVADKTVVEGTVRFRNDRKSQPTSLGVPGSRVFVSGPGRKTYRTTPNINGYWYVEVPRGGDFKVEPLLPQKYQIGNDYVTPKDADVRVPDGGVGNADFLVKDPLKMTLTFDRSSVPAAGASVDPSGAVSAELVNATVKVTEFGAPMPNFQVAILPFEGKTYPVSKLPVLAKICGAPVAWPDTTNTVDANKTIDASTDSTGEVKFAIDVGTTPGALPIEVRPTDQSSTDLQTVDLNRVDPIETLHVTPLGGGNQIVSGIRSDIVRFGYLMGSTPSWGQQLARAAALGELGAINVAPVSRSAGGGGNAVLLYPAGTRLPVSADGSVPVSVPGSVIAEPDLWVGDHAGIDLDYEAAARQNFVGAYPTVAQWLTGGTLDGGSGNGHWNLGSPGGSARMLNSGNAGHWYGLPYDVPGGC